MLPRKSDFAKAALTVMSPDAVEPAPATNFAVTSKLQNSISAPVIGAPA